MIKPNYAEADLSRLLEGHHDLSVLSAPSRLVPAGDSPLRAAAVSSRDALAVAWRALERGAAQNFQDARETSAARLSVVEAVGRAVSKYSFARKQADANWATPDPDAPADATEQTRRQELFARIFSQTPTALRTLGPEKLVEHLSPLPNLIDAEPTLSTLGLSDRLSPAFDALRTANGAWVKERGEDLDATRALDAARADFDRLHRAHELLVESILVRRDKAELLGQYLKARDPAYAARRNAGQPLTEEPDLGILDTDPLPTP